ncbi:MAG TPA: cation:dicarboxylase symporter family transporter, partial [bacterium]
MRGKKIHRHRKPRGGALHHRIFFGMALGIAGGIGLRVSGLSPEQVEAVVRWVKPMGDLFMRFLFMTVVPIVVSALTLGVAEIGDVRRIGRIGLRTLIFTVLVSSAAVITGVVLVEGLRPGAALSAEHRSQLLDRFPLPESNSQSAKVGGTMADALVKIVPKNPLEDMVRAFDPSYDGGGILAVIFFALVLGIALALCRPEKVKAFKATLEGIYEVMMRVIGFGMRFAPIGVFALLFSVSATLGFSIVLLLSRYVAVVLTGLTIHLFGTYS